MWADLPFNTSYVYAGAQQNPIAYNNQYQPLPGLTFPPELQYDGFYKNKDVMLYEKGTVSDLQSKLNDKKQELEHCKKMLLRYPDEIKYGRRIDELNKEIAELEKEIAKASKTS